ncbi:uncharacterized protein N7483_008859 [Penicillium malachiteum]|uniref:uncharacterized protein n=1 Tax=Penicillium malachiteum TaxID=1324776 RepID=UPI002547BB6A|nr:uncharacterized protein N7483_008859 [Penicillium malachiteum]KAJ5720925.1 hypothetical protein N7483_008859 [Penicillium malachiteum]
MASIPTLTRSASRGSDHELSYASPLVIRIAGERPDPDSMERHNSKRRSGNFNDEEGKLGHDGRKRRSLGSSDDEGLLTWDNFHNEDLRVGGPYLCSIPTTSRPVPYRHPKFRLTTLETPEGWSLGQKIMKIIDKFHLKPTTLKFSFIGRTSVINPEPEPCLILWVPAERVSVDDTWLQCARELRSLLIANDLDSCSVEIADPMAFLPMNTFPVLQQDKVFWQWEPLLQELLAQLNLTDIRSIGCFRRGRGTAILDCSPTLLILVDRNKDWTSTREKVISILKRWRFQMLAVEIVKDKPVRQITREGISVGLLGGLINNDGRTMATESIASSRNHNYSGTLGCFLELQNPYDGQWKIFGLTCWHVVVPPFADHPNDDKKVIERWNKNGIRIATQREEIRRLLRVDHPTRLAHKEEVTAMEHRLGISENQEQYQIYKELEEQDALETLDDRKRQNYEKAKSSIQNQKNDLKTLNDRFKNGDQQLGWVITASGFKRKDVELKKDGKGYPTSLDWALIHFLTNPPGVIPGKFAPLSISQSLETHGEEVFMYGYRSGRGKGFCNGLRVAYIEAIMTDSGVETVHTFEYAITGLRSEPFSISGDSGAMIGCNTKTTTHEEEVLIGMVFAGCQKESMTYITRADHLLNDIMQVTKARNFRVFWSP